MLTQKDLEEKTPEELVELLIEKDKELVTANKSLKTQEGVVADLKATVELKRDVEAPMTVTHTKKNYQFTVTQFTVPGRMGESPREVIVTETDWAEEKTLVGYLVKSKSQVLKAV